MDLEIGISMDSAELLPSQLYEGTSFHIQTSEGIHHKISERLLVTANTQWHGQYLKLGTGSCRSSNSSQASETG